MERLGFPLPTVLRRHSPQHLQDLVGPTLCAAVRQLWLRSEGFDALDKLQMPGAVMGLVQRSGSGRIAGLAVTMKVREQLEEADDANIS